VWAGKLLTAHWAVADPAAVEGTDAKKPVAFRTALRELEARIQLLFVQLLDVVQHAHGRMTRQLPPVPISTQRVAGGWQNVAGLPQDRRGRRREN
jgi:hypothetical protein